MVTTECVLGLDLSLTSTGLCMAYSDRPAVLGVITSKGSKDASWKDRDDRLGKITYQILEWVQANREGDLVGVFVEGPSYGSTVGHQHDRSGLWWQVYSAYAWNVPVGVIQPQTRAKYATGAGNASKDTVLAATVKQFLDLDIRNNDIADATQLAAMGARLHGWPIDGEKSKLCLTAMEKIMR
ncbi:hypothetical protein [Glutamicibacter ardleyensis]|uniref:Holliday junction nuclease RuvC n=1 Tax=Glutamicibacter ardleyensis TaxID=225894 RepID=A0ABQ2DGY0_9MICC|nr:hypothetical protein [Glutamicibacter ardleyensis]GGJ56188.1 hypothetical protein GCM10007173_13730 [Glutamicibacter ardleyensis]